jgi:hypothetical protein
MSSAAPAHGRFSRLPGLAFRKLDEQTVIVDPQNRQVHVLNDTGSAIWELLEDRRSLGEMVAALGREGAFDAQEQQIASDVMAFLTELTGKGLLVHEDGGER